MVPPESGTKPETVPVTSVMRASPTPLKVGRSAWSAHMEMVPSVPSSSSDRYASGALVPMRLRPRRPMEIVG